MSESYPYLYARGAYMKKRLLKKEDYQRLLKMELNELVKSLGEGAYKQAIDEMALKLKGVDLIEAALNKSLADFFTHIRRMADLESRLVVDLYLERWDVYNAKTALRAAFSGYDKAKVEHLLIPAGKHDAKFFLDLLSLKTVEEMIAKLDFVPEKARDEMAAAFKKDRSLLGVENILDQHYYTRTLRLGKRLDDENKSFRHFLLDEVAIINIRNIISMKAEGVDAAEIKERLIKKEGKEDLALNAAISANSVEAALEELKKTQHGKFLEGMGKSTPLEMEMACNNYLLSTYASSSYMNPFTLAPLLTIMFIKAAEVSNLKGLVKSRQLGLDDEFIEKKVIVKCWR